MKLKSFPIALFLLLLCIVLIKIPHLSLPYFWDEAWSYGPAVNYMYKHGLSLLPGSLPMEFSRGHPLLFYFLSALAMKIFGAGFIASHIFPLLISLTVIVILYCFVKLFFNEEVAFYSCLLLSCQALFLAQANFILPDMFLVLCTLIAFWGYLKSNKIVYLIGATAFLLTKETGLILILFLILWEIFLFLNRKLKWSQLISHIILLSLPLLPVMLFFLIQKHRIGWYFYPEHIQSIEISFRLFREKMLGYLDIIFINNEKYLLLISTFFCFFFLLKKSFFQLQNKKAELLLMFILFALFYIFCMSFLFFNLRYSLTVLPFIAIIFCSIIFYSFKKPAFRSVVFVCLFFPIAYNAYCKRSSNNETLGYIDVIKSNKQAADYLVERNYSDSVIYVPFVMGINLDSTFPGYVADPDKIFKNLVYNDQKGIQLYIFVDSRPASEMDILVKRHNLILLKIFRSGNAWTALYKPIQ